MIEKDWKGNSRSAHALLGARNYAKEEREAHDYYATEPKAAWLLMEVEELAEKIWECACGEGRLAKEFEKAGHKVIATDLIDRGYGDPLDFLTAPLIEGGVDIITNPPYSKAREFVEHALDIIEDGHKVIMFLKIQFLEGKARKELFKRRPPKVIYVSSSRLHCAMNGDFGKYAKSNAICYAWYVWEKGYKGETIIRWMN